MIWGSQNIGCKNLLETLSKQMWKRNTGIWKIPEVKKAYKTNGRSMILRFPQCRMQKPSRNLIKTKVEAKHRNLDISGSPKGLWNLWKTNDFEIPKMSDAKNLQETLKKQRWKRNTEIWIFLEVKKAYETNGKSILLRFPECRMQKPSSNLIKTKVKAKHRNLEISGSQKGL